MPPLPTPRGPLSEALLARLTSPVGSLDNLPEPSGHPWLGEDAPLALYLCFELQYRGLDEVDDGWEDEPTLVGLRRRLARGLLASVESVVGSPTRVLPRVAVEGLKSLANATGPSLSRWTQSHGELQHLRELAIHRSAYQLKEADPHSLLIPRMPAGRAKSALIEIQADEYGSGVPGTTHQELFAATMRSLGLDDSYGAYLDVIPGYTLSTVNLLSVFGSSRRWLGAGIGHLALFEMTSVGPMGRYAETIRRLTGSDEGARFYDVHVQADEYHQQVAIDGLVVPLLEASPHLAGDVIFGARALTAVESVLTERLLQSWTRRQSSLLTETATPPASIAS